MELRNVIRVTFLRVWGRTGRKSPFSAAMIPLVDKWLGRLLRGFALVLGKVGTAPGASGGTSAVHAELCAEVGEGQQQPLRA